MNKNNNQDRQLQDELAHLKGEHQRLRDEKLRTERDVDHLTGQLEELQAKARQEYGTSDPVELRTLLDKRRRENAAMVAQYREHLDGINKGLAAVEQRVDDSGESNGLNGQGDG